MKACFRLFVLYLAVVEKKEPVSPIPATPVVSTGNMDYEVSDDDYTNDYTEISSKRRRRETRLCRSFE